MTDLIAVRELREQLQAHLDTVTPPPADLDAVRRRSRRLRVRRLAGPGAFAVAAVGVVALALTQSTSPPTGPDGDVDVAAAGPLEDGSGLRAIASPGQKIYMGGRELPYSIERLDTDAAATPYGIAFYDEDGRPWLLEPSGERAQLDDGPSDPDSEFRPTIKADAVRPHVAFAVMDGDDVTVTVYDLDERSVVATTGITCTDGCSDLVVDGIDSGVVLLRMQSGTVAWDHDRDESFRIAGRETRVADARNRVLLYDGVEPTVEMEGWRYVSGAIDAKLTFDGRHVLYWSDELVPTGVRAAGTIKVDLPEPATFFAMDTDGSVLAATVGDPSEVFDCELPSGECERLGEISTLHGDPLFIGADM